MARLSYRSVSIHSTDTTVLPQRYENITEMRMFYRSIPNYACVPSQCLTLPLVFYRRRFNSAIGILSQCDLHCNATEYHTTGSTAECLTMTLVFFFSVSYTVTGVLSPNSNPFGSLLQCVFYGCWCSITECLTITLVLYRSLSYNATGVFSSKDWQSNWYSIAVVLQCCWYHRRMSNSHIGNISQFFLQCSWCSIV